MPEVTMSVKMNRESHIVSIVGVNNKDITINYVGDIDFTPLVEGLLETVSTEKTFVLSITPQGDQDEKEVLINRTISDIVAKYNEVVTAAEAEEG